MKFGVFADVPALEFLRGTWNRSGLVDGPSFSEFNDFDSKWDSLASAGLMLKDLVSSYQFSDDPKHSVSS